MSQDDITLVCEGQPRGRDVRWLNLVLSELAASFEPAGRVKVVPAGSKADLSATVRGMREALRTRRVYAIRDRDFLRAELLTKDVEAGVYPFQRHCLESYVVEPDVLRAALGVSDAENTLLVMAERQFWPDVGRAVLDACGHAARRTRPSLEGETPANKADVVQIVKAKLERFLGDLGATHPDVEGLVDSFELDMRSAPLWMRVNGKDLLRTMEGELLGSILPGGDIEGRLFKWCAENRPPEPFVAEIRRILENLPTSNALAPVTP